MKRSQLTKRELSNTLKTLMLNTTLNKITVKQITDSCGLTRHTFYNHFLDIYDLLRWTYKYEVIDGLEEYSNKDNWKTAFFLVLDYIKKNKVFCMNTYNSMGREHLEMFLYRTTYDVIMGIVDKISNVDAEIKKNEEITEFYSLAICGKLLLWLGNGLKETQDEILLSVSNILDGNIERLVK